MAKTAETNETTETRSNVKKVHDKRLVVVSGPSGVGKGPTIDWLKKLYLPDLCQVHIRKTQTARHTGKEADIGFANGTGRDGGQYYTFSCRGAEQRLSLDELDNAIATHDVVLLESYYTTLPFLKRYCASTCDVVSTFISPVSLDDLRPAKKTASSLGSTVGLESSLDDCVVNPMLDALVRRAAQEGKTYSTALLGDLMVRAKDSLNELRYAHNYSWIIPNHCPESNHAWGQKALIGESGLVVETLRDIVQTGYSKHAIKGEAFVV